MRGDLPLDIEMFYEVTVIQSYCHEIRQTDQCIITFRNRSRNLWKFILFFWNLWKFNMINLAWIAIDKFIFLFFFSGFDIIGYPFRK